MRLVYLDQQHWVALLKAREPQSTELLERLRAAVDANEVAVPLVCGHYLETWHRAQWASRSALAAVMRDLSQWRTLAPMQAVARLETERALQRGPPVTPEEVLGMGANHAFDSPTGRFRMVERAWTRERAEEGAPTPGLPDYLKEIQHKHPEAWEWMNLAGPDVDFPLPGFDDSQLEIRPEHRRGDEFVAHERELVARLAADGMSNRLRDALVMLDLQELLDDINEACLRLKFNSDALRREGAVGHCMADFRLVTYSSTFAGSAFRTQASRSSSTTAPTSSALPSRSCTATLSSRNADGRTLRGGRV